MNTYWWFRPSHVAMLLTMPIVVLSFISSNSFYQEFGTFNVITPSRFFVIWLAIIGFAGGSWVGEVLQARRPRQPSIYMTEYSFRILVFGLGFVATCATILFLAPFATNPALVRDILAGVAGASDTARENANQISGITSQENLFNLVVVLLMLKPILTGRRRSNSERLLLCMVLAITAVKVILHAERIALIEIVVPLSLVTAGMRRPSLLWRLAPLTGIGTMLVFFTGTEYLRSWVSYYADRSDSLIAFAMDRLLAYYATAVNNGAWVFDQINSYYFPVFTAQWLWHLPVPGLPEWLAQVVGIKVPNPEWVQELLAGQNGEFNNLSGLFSPITDFGPALGVLIWVFIGFISGRLYWGFRTGRLLGLILFPTWYVGILEIPRIFYWGDNRFFPTLVVSLSIAYAFLTLAPSRWGNENFGHRADLPPLQGRGARAPRPQYSNFDPTAVRRG